MFQMVFNSAINVLGTLATFLIMFFLTPFMIEHLGMEAWGIWTTIGSILAYSYLLNVGLSNSITRYVPIALTKQDPAMLNRIISTSTLFYALGGGVMAALVLGLGPFVPGFINAPAGLANATLVLFLCTGLSVALTMPMQTSIGMLTGLQRYDLDNAVRLILNVLRAAAVVVFLRLGYGLVAMALIGGLVQVATNVSYWVFIRRLLPNLRLARRYLDWPLFKELISFGFNTFVYVMGSLLIYRSDLVVIGALLGPRDAAVYAVPVILTGMISSVITSATRAMQPAAAVEFAKGNRALLGDYYAYGVRHTTLVLAPLTAFLVIKGRDFIDLWVGADFGLSAALLGILLVGHFFYMSQRSAFEVLSAAGRHKFFGRITIATGVANVAISVTLLKLTNLRLFGVAWGTFISMTVLSGLVLFLYCCRELQVSRRRVVRESYVAGLISILPLAGVLLWLDRYWHARSWRAFMAQGLVAGAVWLPTWLLLLQGEEKAKLRSGLVRVGRKLRP